MKTSTFIRRAVRGHLDSTDHFNSRDGATHSPYICVALSLYARKLGTPRAHEISTDVQEEIMRLINPHGTVTHWLRERLNWCGAKCHPSPQAMYEYRLRWAEDLAQQYEAQGD